MPPTLIPSPAAWAAATFGSAQLGDVRRTARLVHLATALATRPAATLPHQLADPAALKAAYRVLGSDAITPEAILAPHLAQTRQAANAEPVVLLVQDTTTLDFTAHKATTGLAPIGQGTLRGFHLQTVLAMRPAPRALLGVLVARPWLRRPAPGRQTTLQRRARARESAVWGETVRACGRAPDGVRWIHVADRGADCFTFFAACQETGSDLLIRVAQNRTVRVGEDARACPLLDALREEPAQATRPLTIPARPGRAARETTVAVSWRAVTVPPPVQLPPAQAPPAPLAGWGVRVWEPAAPEGVEPVEWLLLTTVPVTAVAEAWERVDWYTARWTVEEYHLGLKTGCRAEGTQLRTRAALWRRLAVLIPLAVRLLLLREASRTVPEVPVTTVVDPFTIRLVAAACRQPPASTVEGFTRQLARLGGHQGRRGDGPPGWRTLWIGWLHVQTLLDGARLAASFDDP